MSPPSPGTGAHHGGWETVIQKTIDCLPGPDCGVVGHVVVRGEELDLGLAAVDDEDDVVNCHRRFGDVRRQDDFSDALSNVAKDLLLTFFKIKCC